LQNFSANPEEKFVRWGKKIRSLSYIPFLKEFGLKKTTIFVCVSGTITIFLGHFPRIREGKRRESLLFNFGPILALFVQICQNSAAEL